jgi:thymidylate synthase
MNNLDSQYQSLLHDILVDGVEKKDRTGTGTKSIFGCQIRHKMSEGFPLLTTKKMAFKTMVTELLWFLRGDTNIKYLIDNNCHIWNGDAMRNYEKHNGEIDWGTFVSKEEAFIEAMSDDEFAKQWGELGPIYGKQWRNWKKPHWTESELSIASGGVQGGTYYTPIQIDQIQNLISELKTNPDSRRLMVSAWNVGELDQMVLPPCHYSFQCYVREGKYLSLMWNQRSVDTFLGLPFNIASYALLLEIIAKAVNMIPDELIGNLGDVHLYNNHIEQAKEQITRTPFDLPKLIINSGNENWHLLEVDEIINTFDVDITFKVENYQSHPAIKAPLSN